MDVALIHWTARKLGRSLAGLEPGDILSEGAIALLQAEGTFDPSRGTWSTYTVPAVRRRLLRAARRARSPVDVPDRFWEGTPRGEPEEQAMRPGVELPPEAVMRGEPSDDAERALAHHEAVSWVRAQLGSLPAPVAFVLSRRLDGETLETIGKALGLTRSRTQQLEAEGIGVLRRRLRRTEA